MVNFFISRPVFATVCSLLFVLAGGISIPTLPIAQYPNLTPPTVTVVSSYTGANAQAVETSVTTLLEQAINGAEGMRYISSTSGNDGTSSINVVFDLNRNLDIAAVDVQNRATTTLGRLPIEVQTTGLGINKNSGQFVVAFAFYSDHNQYDNLFISNYLDVYVRDAIKRIKGVGNVVIFGERKYSMRLWLDPLKLAARGLTAPDVVNALREQNVQVAAGSVGQPPQRSPRVRSHRAQTRRRWVIDRAARRGSCRTGRGKLRRPAALQRRERHGPGRTAALQCQRSRCLSRGQCGIAAFVRSLSRGIEICGSL